MRRRGRNVRRAVLRAVLPVLRVLPPRVAARTVAGFGQAEYALRPGLRRRIDAAVAAGLPHLGPPPDPETLGRALAGNLVRWRIRDRLLDGLPDPRFDAVFAVEGLDALERARARGRGVLLLGNHYGAHMMPPHWLIRRGDPVRLYMERPRSVSKLLARRFDDDGPLGQRRLFISRGATPAEAAGSILRAARILDAGSILFVACDVRWAGAHAAPARFLGHDYTFSPTWVALAATSGAPVVTTFCHMQPDGALRLEFLEPFDVPREARRPEAAAAFVQEALDRIAERVRRSPENSNDYFFWPGQRLAPAPAG